MKYRVIIHDDAYDDLRHVLRHFHIVDAVTMMDWFHRIEAAMFALDDMPHAFGLSDEADRLNRPIRIEPFGKRRGAWNIVFSIEGDTVHILRVRRGNRKPLTRADLD